MRSVPRYSARAGDLKDELCIGAAIRLRCDSDEIRPVIDAVVEYLIENYPRQDLYIPAGVSYPIDSIRADVNAGILSMRQITRKYRCSRSTIYRLLDDAEQGG